MREARCEHGSEKVNWPRQLERILDEAGKRLNIPGQHLSQQVLAEFLGISKGKLQAWLRGQRPSAGDLEHLARALDLSPNWLLLGRGEPVGSVERSWGECAVRLRLCFDSLRDELGLTFSQLCRRARVCEQTCLRVLDGKAIPDPEMLRRLRQEYGISLDWLVTGQVEWGMDGKAAMNGGCGAVLEEMLSPGGYKDPMVQRMETVTRILKDTGADQATIRKAVMALVGAI